MRVTQVKWIRDFKRMNQFKSRRETSVTGVYLTPSSFSSPATARVPLSVLCCHSLSLSFPPLIRPFSFSFSLLSSPFSLPFSSSTHTRLPLAERRASLPENVFIFLDYRDIYFPTAQSKASTYFPSTAGALFSPFEDSSTVTQLSSSGGSCRWSAFENQKPRVFFYMVPLYRHAVILRT